MIAETLEPIEDFITEYLGQDRIEAMIWPFFHEIAGAPWKLELLKQQLQEVEEMKATLDGK